MDLEGKEEPEPLDPGIHGGRLYPLVAQFILRFAYQFLLFSAPLHQRACLGLCLSVPYLPPALAAWLSLALPVVRLYLAPVVLPLLAEHRLAPALAGSRLSPLPPE